MAADDLEIIIRSKGGETVVAAFKNISSGAQSMGVSTEQAAKKSSASMRDMGRASQDLKIGAAALGAEFVLAARSAQSQTREILGIEKAYDDAADQILDFSERIQDSTNFSNDAARQAALAASTITREYGLSAAQAEVLIQRAADLTAIYGGTLVDNTNRLASATRGEAEAAEFLGIAMADSVLQAEAAARGQTGWTTTMTEAEKAAIRFDVMLQQTNFSQGAAAEAADTTAGKVRHLANEVADVATNFAAATGPVGESVAVLSDYALQTGLALAGVTKLASGLKEMGAASKVASLALSPGGILVAAGLATVGIVKLADALSDSYVEAAAAAEKRSETLTESIIKLAEASDARGLLGADWQASFSQAFAQFDNLGERIQVLKQEITDIQRQPVGSEAQMNERDAHVAAIEREIASLEALAQQLGGTKDAEREQAETLDALNKLLVAQGPAADSARQMVSAYLDQMEAGTLGIADGMDLIQAALANLPANNLLLLAFAEASEKAAASQDRYAGSTRGAAKSAAELLTIQDSAAAQMTIFAEVYRITSESIGEFDQGARSAETTMGAIIDATNRWSAAQGELNEQLQRQQIARQTIVASETIDAAIDEREAIKALIVVQKERTLIDAGHAAVAQRGVEVTERQTLALLAQANAAQQLARQEVAQFTGMQVQADDLNSLIAYNAALRENETALERVARGSTSAAVQLRAFKDVQDGIIGSQGEFTHQLGEYGTQLGYLENAEKLLNERREEGVELTKQQEDFLNRVDAAQARLTGGQEDATLALGEQALAYAENMSKGDQLNESLDGVSRTTGDLTGAIRDLITELQGIPAEVESNVTLNGVDKAIGDANSLAQALNSIPQVVNSSVTTTHEDVFIGERQGMHGGVFANGGMVRIIAGEAGYERFNYANGGYAYAATHGAYNVPQGTLVTPHPESAAGRGQMGGGGITINLNGDIHGFSGLNDFLAEAERMIRARFAGLGV